MAIFQCKMCGAQLEVEQGKTVAVCDYCGTNQTLPKLDDDKRANLYGRANHFRRNNEYDKAIGIFEQILNEDGTDAEAYWSLVLCRYGIEYVEDPATRKRVPTVNRAQFTSIFDDEDYKSALKYADGYQKKLYESEAEAINTIQKGILAISQKEKPFDVFICYKETDSNGRRTQDSVLANDLYHQLKLEGFKVFFSRITLEDKLGTAYEPYIFAALNSAKVMVVIGTKPEYFNAVWVKNEWSRYLALIKKGENKMLIPAYKDMDPYDLPDEFSHLQAQDMSKLGFMQDLIRGIKKIAGEEKKQTVIKETVVTNNAPNANVGALIERVFMFLEDGDFESANEYCEKILDIEPKNADAYLGKLLVNLKVKKRENIRNFAMPFDENPNYQKILRFGDEELKKSLQADIQYIKERNETQRKEKIYVKAKSDYQTSNSETVLRKTSAAFGMIKGYKDADEFAKKCLEKAETIRKDTNLGMANSYLESDSELDFEHVRIKNLKDAIDLYKTIPGWKNADSQLAICEERLKAIEAKREQKRLERERQIEKARQTVKEKSGLIKKLAIIIPSAIVAFIIFIVILTNVIIPGSKYNKAVELMEQKKYTEAIEAFEAISGHKDSSEMIEKCKELIKEEKYQNAVSLMKAKKYNEAIKVFDELGDYKESKALHDKCVDAVKDINYNDAMALIAEEKYMEAIELLVPIKDYKDANAKLIEAWGYIVQRDTVSAGSNHTVALKKGGTVVAVGSNDKGQLNVGNWTDIIAVSAGNKHTVGLKKDGTVVAVGDNYFDQCDVESWTDIVAIAAGDYYTVGLKSDGTVVASSSYDVESWTDIVAISAGDNHTVGLKKDGTVVAVGSDTYGQLNVGNWTDIVAVSAGYYHTVGLKKDGTVVAVGGNDYGQCDVNGWVDIIAVSAEVNYTVGLKKDGTVVTASKESDDKRNVQDWENIVAITSGGDHTVGLRKDGTVVAVGEEYAGKCEVGDWADIKVPATKKEETPAGDAAVEIIGEETPEENTTTS